MNAHFDDGNDGDWNAQNRADPDDVVKVDFKKRKKDDGVIDPRNQFARAPEYKRGQLPAIFEDYITDCIASWGGDPGAYACAFLAMHCGVLHSSVRVNTNPLKGDNWRNPNDFSLTLGKSGTNKSGMFKDITRFQTEWQKAMTRAASRQVQNSKRQHPPMCFLQNASVEGMFMQIADNKGDRLLMGCEEAMAFYDGAGAHHKDKAASMMSDGVCAVYDGGMFSKRLVSKSFTIPEALATLVMTTVIEKMVGWTAFQQMTESGLMARHTVGILAHPMERNPARVMNGAEAAMGELMLKLRGLRDTHFTLAEGVGERWLNFTARKEDDILGREAEGARAGLINWCKKYDMRIMSMATILQAYKYIAGNCLSCTETTVASMETDAGKVDGGTKILRTVLITAETLSEAINFVEGYLLSTQAFFYEVAAGVTEFGNELMNFLAYRISTDDPDTPENRILSRDELTFRGPAPCRGAITPQLKETHRRWIQALLDHGFIEVYEHPRARKLKNNIRADNEERWYKLRDELFEHFSSDLDRTWLGAHNDALKARQLGIARAPLAL